MKGQPKEGTYLYRQSLQYVANKPKFIQEIEDKHNKALEEREQAKKPLVRPDEDPIVVDPEGNPICEEAVEKDPELALILSRERSDKKDEPVDVTDLEKDRSPPGKKARPEREQERRQLSKLKSNTRLLSFED